MEQSNVAATTPEVVEVPLPTVRLLVMPEVEAAFPDHEILSTSRSMLPCPLTDSELLQRGQLLAALQGRLAAHVAQAKEVAATLKSEKDAIETEIGEVARAIRRKAEDRMISTAVLADYKTNAAITVRQDSVEELYRRALTPDERQRVLFPGARAEEADSDSER